jgi:hypothetical protein
MPDDDVAVHLDVDAEVLLRLNCLEKALALSETAFSYDDEHEMVRCADVFYRFVNRGEVTPEAE